MKHSDNIPNDACSERSYGYFTSKTGNYELLRRAAKSNRRYPTTSEFLLWQYLRGKQLGVRFRRQHPIGDYIPDFVCLSHNLIIEVDGGYHYVNGQPLNDAERTEYLHQKGFQVIRFTNEEVNAAPEVVIQKIKKALQINPNYKERHRLDQPKEHDIISTDMNDSTRIKTKSTVESIEPKDTMSSLPFSGKTCSRRLSPPWEGAGEVKGRLLIFSAPSGSGKSTIINWLMTKHPELNLAFSISCTSRAPRGTEQDGVEYFFLTPDEFRAKIAADEFLEYEEVYQDRFYGTLKSQVEKQSAAGQNVVFDVDVKGGCNIKQFYGDRAMSLFIQPPSIDALRQRLVGRNTDAPEVIEQRLARAAYELAFAPCFDHVIINDDLEKAKQETYQLIKDFLGI